MHEARVVYNGDRNSCTRACTQSERERERESESEREREREPTHRE